METENVNHCKGHIGTRTGHKASLLENDHRGTVVSLRAYAVRPSFLPCLRGAATSVYPVEQRPVPTAPSEEASKNDQTVDKRPGACAIT